MVKNFEDFTTALNESVKTNIKDISDIDLSELRTLFGDILHSINTYSHVSGFISKSFNTALEKEVARIDAEFYKREEEL